MKELTDNFKKYRRKKKSQIHEMETELMTMYKRIR